MKNLQGKIIGVWKVIGFDRCISRTNNGQTRKRYFWNIECTNCRHLKCSEESNIVVSKCQKCWGLSRGISGFNELFDSYQRAARKHNRDFSLTKNVFKCITSQPCYYCNSPPSKIKNTKADSNWGDYCYNGIDRIQNDIGYTKFNCVPCCLICNRAKNSLSYGEFLAYINRIRSTSKVNMLSVNYINGHFVRSKKMLNSFDPSTGKINGQYPETTNEDILTVVQQAKLAQKKWRQKSRINRGEYFNEFLNCMEKKQKEIIDAISFETGKTYNESRAEYMESVHMIQYTIGQARDSIGKVAPSEIAEKDIYILRKPKGVIAVVSPFNFPFAIPLWCSAPSLLEGNAVVFKPSEETPYTGHLITEIYHAAGFPEGVFNTVHGTGEITGKALIESDIDHICFTGSVEVGKIIRQHCASTLNKTCSCEMGGKNAVVIFDDFSVDLAVKNCIASAFKLSGQRCVSASRLLVHKNVLEEFCRKFIDACKNLKIGGPLDGDMDFGPIINEKQMNRILDYNNQTKIDEVKVLMEGIKENKDGYFLTPHVYLCDWNKKFNFLTEEVFGPHVAIIPFNTIDEAIEIYNDTQYGLSLSVLTNNHSIMKKMREECEFGVGYVNLPCVGAESHLPFGGLKASGFGGSSAAGTFHAVTNEITWTINNKLDGFEFCQGLK